MRRTLLFAVAAALAGGAAFLLWPSSQAPAQPNQTEAKAALPAAPSASATELPIAQVVLFSSGVGYFQREGTVQGNARIDLTFPVQDINDLLKSMVLQDLDGGNVAAVSYDSHDPVERTLKSFAVDLTGNPSLYQLLEQARKYERERGLESVGEEVGAEVLRRWEETLTGLEGDRASVATTVDWVAKERVYLAYQERHGIDWEDVRLRALDLARQAVIQSAQALAAGG